MLLQDILQDKHVMLTHMNVFWWFMELELLNLIVIVILYHWVADLVVYFQALGRAVNLEVLPEEEGVDD